MCVCVTVDVCVCVCGKEGMGRLVCGVSLLLDASHRVGRETLLCIGFLCLRLNHNLRPMVKLKRVCHLLCAELHAAAPGGWRRQDSDDKVLPPCQAHTVMAQAQEAAPARTYGQCKHAAVGSDVRIAQCGETVIRRNSGLRQGCDLSYGEHCNDMPNVTKRMKNDECIIKRTSNAGA